MIAAYIDDKYVETHVTFRRTRTDKWPADTEQIVDALKSAKTALKHMKTSYIYARIAMEDTEDYAQALRLMYLQNDSIIPRGIEVAASEAILAMESQAAAIADGAATILAEAGIEFLDKSVGDMSQELLKKVAGETFIGSMNLYLDIIDASLSLFWPVNEAYSELSKMTVYQSIQYDALNVYYKVPKQNQEVTLQDISNGRTAAIIFLKTAKKCYHAQQGTFDLFGDDGTWDWQIEQINKKIREFELSSLAEKRDAITNKEGMTQELKALWSDLIPSGPTGGSNESIKTYAKKILGDWYTYKHGGQSDFVSCLSFKEDGTASCYRAVYASDVGISFSGHWEISSADDTSCVVHLEGTAGEWVLGYDPDFEEYSADIRLEIIEDRIFIEGISSQETYWLDQEWHVRNLEYGAWRQEEETKMFNQYKDFFYYNFSDADKVCLVDVTHDGYRDMLIVHEDNSLVEGLINGYVFTATEGFVKRIYTNTGGRFSIMGGFDWYIKTSSGAVTLGESDRSYAVPNMAAEHYFVEYYLDNAGNIYEVSKVEYTPLDNLGPECSKEFEKYSVLEATAKSSFYALYELFDAEHSDTLGQYPTDPQIVFSGNGNN